MGPTPEIYQSFRRSSASSSGLVSVPKSQGPLVGDPPMKSEVIYGRGSRNGRPEVLHRNPGPGSVVEVSATSVRLFPGRPLPQGW